MERAGRKKPGPLGGGRKGSNQGPPDLDEALKKFQKTLAGWFGGRTGGGGKGKPPNSASTNGLLAGILLISLALYFWNAIYVVDEKERAVILRFGQYVETVTPGLHIYFPPIERRFQEPVTELRNYRITQEMLTEDENIVEVTMSIQYNIGNLQDYILNVADPELSLREATQSALRHVVGSSKMYQILTEGRQVMGDEVKHRLQGYLSTYGSGIHIVKVNIESSHPPKQVLGAFDDVIRAREEEQREKNRAEAYANQVVPEARGDAQRILEEAGAYRDEVVSRAKGDAARFTQLLGEYSKAPKVTRNRLYIETMEQMLTNSSKVLVDVDGGNNIMYLPLDKMIHNKDKKGNGRSPHSRAETATTLSQEEIGTLTDRVTAELNRRLGENRAARGAR